MTCRTEDFVNMHLEPRAPVYRATQIIRAWQTLSRPVATCAIYLPVALLTRYPITPLPC